MIAVGYCWFGEVKLPLWDEAKQMTQRGLKLDEHASIVLQETSYQSHYPVNGKSARLVLTGASMDCTVPDGLGLELVLTGVSIDCTVPDGFK